MDIKVEIEKTKAIVHISGSVDISGAEKLKQTLDQVAENKPEEVTIDLEGVDSIGSSGIEALRLFGQVITSRGGSVQIVNVNNKIRPLFASAKLDKLFNI
jgi:anti-anti-sigma factor